MQVKLVLTAAEQTAKHAVRQVHLVCYFLQSTNKLLQYWKREDALPCK